MELLKKLLTFFQTTSSAEPTKKSLGRVKPLWLGSAANVGNDCNALSWPKNNSDFKLELDNTYYQFFIGVNSLLNIKLNAFEREVIKSLKKCIKNNQHLADDIPRLPDIIPRLIHLFRDTNFIWKQVADEIYQDPVLLINIVKIANSPAYNLQAEAGQLEHVLVQLGLQEVKKIMMKVALKPILNVDGGHFLKHSGSKIWIDSIKTAEACASLANAYNEDVFNAYLAGLLHNLGQTIIIKEMDNIKIFEVPRSTQFKDQLLFLSRQISVNISEAWGIDERIIYALNEQKKEAKHIKSALGKILYEGSAVSKKHILVAENRWQSDENRINEPLEQEFEQAYKKLDSISF